MRVLVLSLLVFCSTYTCCYGQIHCWQIHVGKCSDYESVANQIQCDEVVCFDWDSDIDTPNTCSPPGAQFTEEEVPNPNGTVNGYYTAVEGQPGLSNLTVQNSVLCYRKANCSSECTNNKCKAGNNIITRTYYTFTGTPCVG